MARLVYLGTPEAAVPPLRALVSAGHDVALVVSRPDKRRGRGGDLVPSPVKSAAIDLGLDVTDELDRVSRSGAEMGVVVAYGRIIPVSVLDALPMVNLHFSLLPRWRGAAPVERAILAGDERTGVDLMAVEEGLDTGDIFAEEVVEIGPGETAAELRSRLVDAGCRLLVASLAGGLAGLPPGRPQVGEPVYAEKLRPEEFEIDWTAPAERIERLARLGRAWTVFRGKRLRVMKVELTPPDGAGDLAGLPPGRIRDGVVATGGEGAVQLVTVQPEGRQPMDAGDWARGARPGEDDLLGAPD